MARIIDFLKKFLDQNLESHKKQKNQQCINFIIHKSLISEGITFQLLSTTCSCTPQLQNSFVFSSKTWALLPTKFASFKIHSLLVVELFCHSLQNSLIICLQNLLVIKFNKTSRSSCLPCDFNLHFVSVIEASILITCAPFGEESIRPHLSRQNCSFYLSR